MKEPSDHYTVIEHANRTIQMTANFEGFPQPTLKWFKPNGHEVWETEQNIKVIYTESSTTLKLLNAQLEDSGSYLLKGTNGVNATKLTFNVSVISPPVLTMDDVYVVEGREAHLNCTVMSYPTAVVTFLFQPCSLKPRWPTCRSPNQNFSVSLTRIYKRNRPSCIIMHFVVNALSRQAPVRLTIN